MGVVTLGLDLGVASIGWALVNEENGTHKLIHWGSRIFQAGVDDLTSGKGTSRCATAGGSGRCGCSISAAGSGNGSSSKL